MGNKLTYMRIFLCFILNFLYFSESLEVRSVILWILLYAFNFIIIFLFLHSVCWLLNITRNTCIYDKIKFIINLLVFEKEKIIILGCMNKSCKELYVVNKFLITTYISPSIKKTMKSLRFTIDLVIVCCKNKFVPK